MDIGPDSDAEGHSLAMKTHHAHTLRHFLLVLVLVLVSRMTQAASHRDVLKLCCSPPAADFFAQFPHSNANNKKLGVSFRPIT